MLRFKVMGNHYVAQEDALAGEIYRSLKEGDIIRMEAEPDNPADPNAIMVIARGHKIGYVPRTRTADVHPYINDPRYRFVYQKGGYVAMLKKVPAYRTIPRTVTVEGNVTKFDGVPVSKAKVYAIHGVEGTHIIETPESYILSGVKDALYVMLDKTYKRIPLKIYVFNENLEYLDAVSPLQFIERAVRANNGLATFKMLGTMWGEFKSDDINARSGLSLRYNDKGKLVVNFKERQLVARLQLFRQSDLPYIGIVVGGFDLNKVYKFVSGKNPLELKNDVMTCLEYLSDKITLRLVPAAPGNAIGNFIHKFHVVSHQTAWYAPKAYDKNGEECVLWMKVYNSQKDLGLGQGAIRCRPEIQDYLIHSTSLIRTRTIAVSREKFFTILTLKNKVRGRRYGTLKDGTPEEKTRDRSLILENSKGERVNIMDCVGTWNSAIDYAEIVNVEGVHNAKQREYYLKFTVEVVYDKLRTGDKILSYGPEFIKGTVVTYEDGIDPLADIEGTWDNIKGAPVKYILKADTYSIIEINPNTIQVVERGPSNARWDSKYGSNDAYELMIISHRFPELAPVIAKLGDPKLKTVAEAMRTFLQFKGRGTKVSQQAAKENILAFERGDMTAFNTDEERYVEIKAYINNQWKWIQFPLPTKRLIEAMANEYDTGMTHHIVVVNYLRMIRQYIDRGRVNLGTGIQDGTTGLKYFLQHAEKQLYKFYSRPRLNIDSSVKRVLNHMERTLLLTVAVDDRDPILQGQEVRYKQYSIYPNTNPDQVVVSIVRAMSLTRFKREFYMTTGRILDIESLGDSVLASPDFVNLLMLKDADGDTVVIRDIEDQKAAKRLYIQAYNQATKIMAKMKYFFPERDELWQVQEPKEMLPDLVVDDKMAIKAMSAAIGTKFMIGMITRQVRKTTFAILQIQAGLDKRKDYKKWRELEVFLMQISKAQQNVIDGLKHERQMAEAVAVYDFLRFFNRVNFNDNKDKLRKLFNEAPFRDKVWEYLPEVKSAIDKHAEAIAWLFGDDMIVHENDKPGQTIRRMHANFLKTFGNLGDIYYDNAPSLEVVDKILASVR